MPYKELRKLYYGSEEEYKRIYEERYNASSTIHMDFIVSKHDCFFTQDNEVIKLMSDILKLDKQIALLRKEMPGIALGQYSRKCLIDEIVIIGF